MLLARGGSVCAPGPSGAGAASHKLDGPTRWQARGALYAAAASVCADPDVYALQTEAAVAWTAGSDCGSYLTAMSRVVSRCQHRGPAAVSTMALSPEDWVTDTTGAGGGGPAPTSAAGQALVAKAAAMLAAAKAEVASLPAAGGPGQVVNTCPRCKATDGISVLSKAIRSGDEGMVDHCTCTKCGKSWKA